MTDISRRTTAFGLVLLGAVGVGGACSRSGAAEIAVQSYGRARADLYNCDGCQADGERDATILSSSLVLASPSESGERMHLSGRVLAVDGVTPVEGVVIYAHHTNAEGLYANGSNETLWSQRHGRLRGWVRTDVEGRYAFDTIKPAPYPAMTMPARVHLFIQEPGTRPYYIDDVVFDDEFKVDQAYRARQELRGGTHRAVAAFRWRRADSGTRYSAGEPSRLETYAGPFDRRSDPWNPRPGRAP